MKFEPVAVSVKDPLPAVLLLGLILLSEGEGLVTVKFVELEVPPPGLGLRTVIG